MPHNRDAEVDDRPGDDRLSGGQVEHLTIARHNWCADADGVHRRPGPRRCDAAGVPAIGHHHDAGDGPVGVVGLDRIERRSQIAPSGLGTHARQVHGGEGLAKAPELDLKLVADRRAKPVANQRNSGSHP